MNSSQVFVRLTMVLSALMLWLLINLYFFWIKVAGGIFLITGLIELVCFLILIIATIFLISRMMRNAHWRNLKNYITIGFTMLILLILYSGRLDANEDTFQSPVTMRACYEGTMNTSRLYFRENGSFEDFNIGWFAFVHYYRGTWDQHGDTLLMKFEGEKPPRLDENLMIKGQFLYKIQSDTLAPTFYYLGYCKGLN